jgi:glutaredoxin
MKDSTLTKTSLTFLISLCVSLLAGAILLQPARQPVQAQASDPPPADMYVFWSDTCPHCAEAMPVLEGFTRKYPQLRLHDYEVHAVENQTLFKQMAAAFGFEAQSVPTIFLGDRHWVGFNEEIGEEIKAAVTTCLDAGCTDAGAGIVPQPAPTPAPTALPQSLVSSPVTPAGEAIDIPILGTVNLANKSLFLSTALIAFVDGFNPCSLWVLSMLLALTLHTGSRKKVTIIGLVFLSVTALVYALFIAGLFTIFTVINFVGWIQILVAVVALFFALVNIKDYFWYKEGLSFTIADSQKPGIFQRIRRVMDAGQSFWGLVGATIVMAAGVSLVEFSCTAGFPVLWTNLLAAQNVEALAFVSLLIVYMLIYQLDELAIFFTAVLTLKASKLEEKHGRILKLAGGMLMLTLAGVMLTNPTLMNNLGTSLLIFGAALAATLLVLLFHRTILPQFGVWVGTEKQTRKPKHD